MIDGKVLVHLRAPALTKSGYGAHSREILDYLMQDDRFFVVLESINWGNCGFLTEADFSDKELYKKYAAHIIAYEQLKDKQEFDMSIQVTIPNEFQRRAKVNVGVTAGIEVDRVSREWVHKCNEMDVLVLPSVHSAKVLNGTVYTVQGPEGNKEERVNKPIFVIPEFYREYEPKDLDLSFPTRKNFLFVGQWGNKGGYGEDRKNIPNLVKVFLETFKDNKDVGLILKVQTVNGSVTDKKETERKLGEIKANFKNPKCKIYLLHQDLKDEEMWALYNHPQVSAFVSMTFGEGFGRPLLEAAAAGKPVFATEWSGQLDFLRKKNGFIPFDFEMAEIPDCQIWPGVIEKGSMWARVNEKDASKKLRKFVDSSKKLQEIAQNNVPWIKENFSKEATFKKWDDFFSSFVKNESEKGKEGPVFTNPQTITEVDYLRSLVAESEKKKVLYIIPQSAGDCLISTAIIDSLIKSRHWDTDYDFYVSTTPAYRDIFEKLTEDFGVRLIEYNHSVMFNMDALKEVFDHVYSPGINIQFTFSNWLLGNGEYSNRLLEEFAKHCNLNPRELTNYNVKVSPCDLPERDYIIIHPGGEKSSKTYKYWPDVLSNIKEMVSDVDLIQIGSVNEPLLDGVLDYRGKPFSESFFLIKNALMLLGVDSFPAHAAAAMQTPHIVLYGNTDAYNCAPVMLRKAVKQVAIEALECNPKCYKDTCKKSLNGEKNCLSHINSSTICSTVYKMLEDLEKEKPDEVESEDE